jgi:SAM-dependent methyltransferase
VAGGSGPALSSSPDLEQFRVGSTIDLGIRLTIGSEAERQAYYVLGRSAEEVERLQSQAAFIRPFTERLFRDAGIARGMKVLDLGSGAGDVALLAARLVGQEGTVVGIDTNPAILEVARTRAAQHRNVLFEAGDIRTLSLARDFDAAVGRYVLMFNSDPAHTMREIVDHLRPGGIAAFKSRILLKALMPLPLLPFWTRLGIGLLRRFETPAPTQRWDPSCAISTSEPGFLTFTWRPIVLLEADQIGAATPI